MGVKFQVVADKLKRLPLAPRYQKFLCIDPGETTGWALFEFSDIKCVDSLRIQSGQLNTPDVPEGAALIEGLVSQYSPHSIVVESYRVYGWRIREHAWADLHTPRLIGAIQYMAYNHSLPMIQQTAQQGKDFCTDDRLIEWNLWKKGERHARDAIRHGVTYVLFDKSKN